MLIAIDADGASCRHDTSPRCFRNRRFHTIVTDSPSDHIIGLLVAMRLEQSVHRIGRRRTWTVERVIREGALPTISSRLLAILSRIRTGDALQLADGLRIIWLWLAGRPVLLDGTEH